MPKGKGYGESGKRYGGTSGTPKIGNSDIGTTGSVGGNKSSEGGQYPFLPSADSYSGGMSRKGVSSGKSSGTTKTNIPFLPDKPAKGK